MTAARDHSQADQKAARRSPGRPPIPLDRILATALQIVDEEGAEALSMRTLAQRLGSGTATLYRHFDSRAAVISQVVDRVFGEVELDAAALMALGWRQACWTVAHTMFDVLGRHNNVAPLLAERIPLGPNAMAQREVCVAFLIAGGFPPKLAAQSYTLLARYVLGFAIQITGDTNGSEDEAVAAATFHGSDPETFPATAAIADLLPIPLQEEFDFGLELILSGLDRLIDVS